MRFLGLTGHRAARKQGRSPTAGSACSTWASRWRGAPRVLLLDEPLAGLAAAERERVGGAHQAHVGGVPVLLVEHDIDRVFALADRVTVMNEGAVLVDGTVAEARDSPAVREVYIGSGTAALAAQAARPRRAPGRAARCSSSTASTRSTARATS